MKTRQAEDREEGPQLRILIVGGYGTFGARLVECLSHDARLELIIAGRSFAKAQALCSKPQTPEPKARLIPAVFDRDENLDAQLEALAPQLVIDMSGPFQTYGQVSDTYRLPQHALARNINYLDIADSATFVTDFDQLNDEAERAGVYALSGVSTCPALTCAVIKEISKDIPDVKRVTAGIAPSPRAPLGEAVIRSICSYAGKPVSIRKHGNETTANAVVDSLNHTISIPGAMPLPPKHFTLVHVPDLSVIAKRWPSIESVWFGAGPTPEIFHRILNALARLVSWRVLPNLSKLAAPMSVIQKHINWGEHRSGMFVEVSGQTHDGSERAATWHLLAEGDVGPTIPILGIAAIIQQHLDGTPPPAGARSSDHDLKLEHYANYLEERHIRTHITQSHPKPMGIPLYKQILRDEYSALPKPIQEMHNVRTEKRSSGIASVTGSSTWIASLVARLFSFPPAAEEVNVNVVFHCEEQHELWTRTFGTKSFQSTHEVGRGRNEGLLVERFGPMAFGLALISRYDQLHLVMQRWQLLGVPMPKWAAPRIAAYESVDDKGRFRFSVKVALPIVGTLVEYRGWLISE